MAARPHPDWLRPTWAAPGAGALMSTRHGGVSEGLFESLNLRDGLGDTPAAVAHNLQRFAASLGAPPQWLTQVHGSRVRRLQAGAPALRGDDAQADASITTERGVACAIQVADCLPVLFVAAGADGRAVAVGAAHAGWRGLAAGVLEATLAALCDACGATPPQVQAWLGPCIGPRRFEVGADVLLAFGADPEGDASPRFIGQGGGKWLADLAGLARDRLQAAGVAQVDGGRWCTVEDASRFFSYRRDGVTGRMAAAVWLD